MSSQNKIRAVFIMDIIGRPPEHLVEMLEKLIAEMANEKGVEVKSKSIKDPIPMKENKEFYTTFAEVEIETEDVLYLAILMFKYMPAHIEVISPEIIAIPNTGWSDILSELARRLHAYDEMARLMQLEHQKLLLKIKELGGEIPPEEMARASLQAPREEPKKEPTKTKSSKKASKKR